MAWLRFAANYVEHQRLLLQQLHRDLAVARLKKIFHRTGQMLNQQTGHPWVRQWRSKYATLQQVHKVQHTQWTNRPGAPTWPPRCEDPQGPRPPERNQEARLMQKNMCGKQETR